MTFRHNIAKASAKLSAFAISHLTDKNASNFPGSLALKIDACALKDEVDRKVRGKKIVVVGTNGKTSVTNLIALILDKQGFEVVCNRKGANLKSGITTTILLDRPGDVGVFESDELWLKESLPELCANYVLLLNLFRDQLDRCGEIERIQSSIVEALSRSPKTTLIYNADDPLCTQVAQACENQKIAFGVDEPLSLKENTVSDTTMCQNCDGMLEYEFRQYDKLGKYSCPHCGFARPELDHAATNVEMSAQGTKLLIDGETFESKLTGSYNVYNMLACAVAGREMGASREAIQMAFMTFDPQNGRLQRYEIDGKNVLLNLAKNPTGYNQNLRIIANAIDANKKTAVAFFINDLTADGHDISWIWDVDFEELAGCENVHFFAGGTRKNDLQVRLKYAGIDADLCESIFDALVCGAQDVFAIANYTALPGVKKDLDRAAEAKEELASEEFVASSMRWLRRDSSASPQNDNNAATQNGSNEAVVKIAHLMPELLNLYGDGGNVRVLRQRLAWRDIPVEVVKVFAGDEPNFDDYDLVVMGGSPDREQELASREMQKWKESLSKYIENGGPLLAICGSYQVLGKSWLFNDEEVAGLGILDIDTPRPGTSKDRLVNNIALENEIATHPIIGFENHAGRTYLGEEMKPFGKVVSKVGCGNNEDSHADGVLYKNCICTYLHGPCLSKNPEVADFLLEKALGHELSPLDDAVELAANAFMAAEII